jgi:molybdopterin-guanine dinucleotide biosynthesis protein B
MVMPKFVAVVGGKHSGKTTVVQHLISELRRRGYRVGSVKEMPRAHWIDVPGKDTWEHGRAGAEIVIAAPLNETICFIKKKPSLNEMLSFFHGLDYIVLEGFENEKTFPKIIAAKDADEASAFSDGLAIAVSGIIVESDGEVRKASILKVPIVNCEAEAEKLADMVEQKAFPNLPCLSHCGECGYSSCYEFAKAIVAEKEKAKKCPLLMRDDVVLEVNGDRVPLKLFPRLIIKNMVIGMVSSLNGVKEIAEVKIVVKKKVGGYANDFATSS